MNTKRPPATSRPKPPRARKPKPKPNEPSGAWIYGESDIALVTEAAEQASRMLEYANRRGSDDAHALVLREVAVDILHVVAFAVNTMIELELAAADTTEIRGARGRSRSSRRRR